MNDNTILRIKVPAHLYESVKAQLTLKEFGPSIANVSKERFKLEDLINWFDEKRQNKELQHGFKSQYREFISRLKGHAKYQNGYVPANFVYHAIGDYVLIHPSNASAKEMNAITKIQNAHGKELYNAIRNELTMYDRKGNSLNEESTINEAKKAGHNYGAGMEVVKEKKMKTPKDGMKKIEEEQVDEAAPGVEYAWIPAAAAGLGIAASVIKSIVGYMKDNNLKGMQGFLRAYKEVGKDASSTIDKKMGGNMEEAKEEKKEEDK
jgi:hypothetical protein